MKLVSFVVDGSERIGALLPGEASLSDFTAAGTSWSHRMLALIDGGDTALEEARALVERPVQVRALDTVRLLAPVPVPRQMYDCLTFEKHLLQARGNSHLPLGGKPSGMPRELSPVFKERPVYYKPNRFAVVGAGVDIVKPRYSDWLDYELEFGVFLGKGGKDMTVEQAADAIFGYCIFNDVSARDQQYREMPAMLGPSKGKDFDTGNVMGPWLVTRDEIADAQALTMEVWVNGEQRCRGTSADMLHSFPQIIAYASADETRRPGEFFASGTVGGGCGLELGIRLEHGDVIEMEVSGLGRLRNRVVFQDGD